MADLRGITASTASLRGYLRGKLQQIKNPKYPQFIKFLLELKTNDAFNEIYLCENIKNSEFLRKHLGKGYYKTYQNILKKVKTFKDIAKVDKEILSNGDEYLNNLKDYAKNHFIYFFLTGKRKFKH